MPNTPVTHYNPDSTYGKTRCGRRLARVKNYTSDINDATCNRCLELEKKHS